MVPDLDPPNKKSFILDRIRNMALISLVLSSFLLLLSSLFLLAFLLLMVSLLLLQ
jgi:hypothetical protein